MLIYSFVYRSSRRADAVQSGKRSEYSRSILSIRGIIPLSKGFYLPSLLFPQRYEFLALAKNEPISRLPSAGGIPAPLQKSPPRVMQMGKVWPPD